jgi:hypothetical protein
LYAYAAHLLCFFFFLCNALIVILIIMLYCRSRGRNKSLLSASESCDNIDRK